MFSAEWQETIDGIVTFSCSSFLKSEAKIWDWAQLTGWDRASETLTAIGFEPDAKDHWQVIGMVREQAPTPDMLEARRRAFQSIMSACAAWGWSAMDTDQGKVASAKVDTAISACQGELPDIIKK